MQHIRGLLFDKDGTLFDFKTTWGAWADRFFREIASDDQARAADLAGSMGFDLATGAFHKDSVIIAGTPEDIMQGLQGLLPEMSPGEIVALINRISAEVPQQEAVPLSPLLSAFRGWGLKLGVATNDAEAPARAHLGSVGVLGYFDFVAGFDSGYGAKPDTGMQTGFCAAVGLAARDVAMVGDSLHDLVAGRAAGMTTIGVLTGMAETEELAVHADVVLAHIGQIPKYLGLG